MDEVRGVEGVANNEWICCIIRTSLSELCFNEIAISDSKKKKKF